MFVRTLLLCVIALSFRNTFSAVPTLRYNATLLAYSKYRVQKNDVDLLPPYQSLLSSADNLLDVGPWSVLNRSIPALFSYSSNPREYQSFATYFWNCTYCCPLANSIDVSSNGPSCSIPGPCNVSTGLPYIDCDGNANDELISEYHSPLWSNVHGAVATLGLAYYYTDDEKYAVQATKLIRTWFYDPVSGMIPNLDHAQSIPGVCSGRPQGIIDFSTGGFLSVLETVTFISSSQAWTTQDNDSMTEWTKQFLEWLLTGVTSRYDYMDEPNNHRTWINALIFGTAIWLDNTTVVNDFLANFPELINSQINASGQLHFEAQRSRGLTYSNMCLHAYLDIAAEISNYNIGNPYYIYNFNASDGGSIRQAIQYIEPFAIGGVCWPYEQFTNYDWGSSYYDTLRQAAAVYNHELYANYSCQVPNGPYTNDLTNLLWPYPPTPDVLTVPYCTSKKLVPKTLIPTTCNSPTGELPACNYPPSNNNNHPNDHVISTVLGGISGTILIASLLYVFIISPYLRNPNNSNGSPFSWNRKESSINGGTATRIGNDQTSNSLRDALLG